MECPHIPEISYAQFGEGLYKEAVANRIPLGGSFELTFRCNLRCVHCYLKAASGKSMRRGRGPAQNPV